MSPRRIWPVVLILLAVSGCTDPSKTVSLASYNSAVSFGTETELARRGIDLKQRPVCHSSIEARQVERGGGFTIWCGAVTVDRVPVSTEGQITAVGTPAQREHYIVRLANTEIVNAPCLGDGCDR